MNAAGVGDVKGHRSARGRRLLIAVCVFAAVAGGGGALAEPAFACAYGGSCHGVIRWDTGGVIQLTGGLATVNASTLSVPNGSTDFSNHEMWVSTNNTTAALGPYVEEGLKYGTENGSTNEGTILFWAEWNTAFQFGWHRIGIAGLNTNYNVKISYSGSSSWGVYLNGNQLGGTSHNQPCCSVQLQVGGETTSNSAAVNATASNLQKRNTSNSWSYNWGGGPYTDGPGNPLVPGWLTTGASMFVHT